MAGNFRSLCCYASRLDQRLLGASSWMNWIVNGLDAKCHGSGISWLSFVIIDNRMLKIITSVFIVTRRLEKHSVLKFICFKLLGPCNILTFLLSFFSLYFMTFSVCWLLDRSCLHFFSIWFLACVFWHTVFSICFFWHLLFCIHYLF